MSPPPDSLSQRRQAYWLRTRRLTGALLVLWLIFGLGVHYFARELSFSFMGWPFSFWLAAQGSVLLFLALIVVHATLVNRWEAQAAACEDPPDAAGP